MWIVGYWVFPVISAAMWLGMLLAMIISWSCQGYPIYPSMDAGQDIAYISDVGAFGLKPLFITGSVITTVFLDLGFASERWLRHNGKLIRNTSKAQKVLSVFGIIFGILGSAGLILLSIFDTYHHPHLHDGFLLLFLGGYIISAIFICAEYQRLGLHFHNHRILRVSFWTKLTFIVLEVILAIVFVATNFTNRANIAAGFEWTIAFIFTFYILSFLLDLLPAVRTKHHVPQGLQDLEKRSEDFEQNLTNDSNGPNFLSGDSRGPSYAGYRGTDAPTQSQSTSTPVQSQPTSAPVRSQPSSTPVGYTVHDTATVRAGEGQHHYAV